MSPLIYEGLLENVTDAGGVKTLASFVQELHLKENGFAVSNPPLLAMTLPLTLDTAESWIPFAAPLVHTYRSEPSSIIDVVVKFARIFASAIYIVPVRLIVVPTVTEQTRGCFKL